MSARWLVAGAAGGVGTTTVTALLFAGCRQRFTAAPQVFDHTGGTLGTRLPDGDEVRAVDPRLALHDFGPHAHAAAIDELADPDTTVLVVGAATPVGADQAAMALQAISDRLGADGLGRSAVVLATTFGRHRLNGVLPRLRSISGLRGVEVLGHDDALAAGGRIPSARLSRRTRSTMDAVVSLMLPPDAR